MHRRHTPLGHPPQYPPPHEDDILEDFRDFAVVPGIKSRLALKACIEGCARCGERTPPFLAGYNDGEFVALCVECGDVDPPVSVIRDGRRGPVPLITPWDAEDHQWFSEHPNRQLRLRPLVPDEPCLRDYPDAAERIADARQRGCVVGILVWWNGSSFVREAGTFSDIEMCSFTDAAIRRLIEPGPTETVQ